MDFTCRMIPKMIRTRPVSSTRLDDVQPTILLTIKRRAPAITSANPPYCLRVIITLNSQLSTLNSQLALLFLGSNEFVSLAMNVDDLNLIVSLQMLAQLGDIDVHGTGIEVVVVNPDGLQSEITL